MTNQAGIARGIFKESFVAEAHRHIATRLGDGGAHVDGFYYCPHHPDGKIESFKKACECRKPAPGMLRAAAADLDLDLSKSFMVGDRWHDLAAGVAAGTRGVLVRTGYGRTEEASPTAVRPAAITDNLVDAVSWILRES